MDGLGLNFLQIDPLPSLLNRQDAALIYFVERDLLEKNAGPVEKIWNSIEAKRLVVKQLADGAWHYKERSNHPAPNANYDLLESYRVLRLLIEKYGFNREHATIEKCAEYIFSCQTEEGDIRGILGNQYMPYYHGAILELLIKAGYANDKRTINGLEWLFLVRQTDGGWIVPYQQVPAKLKNAFWRSAPVLPERERPHSHLATGMAIRALAAHPVYRQRPETHKAGERLLERFFQADKYNDRKAPAYWLKFQFPYWWPNLLTGLDSLSRIGFDRQDPRINQALDWFRKNQCPDGLWETGYPSGSGAVSMRYWVGLAVCRVLKAYQGEWENEG